MFKCPIVLLLVLISLPGFVNAQTKADRRRSFLAQRLLAGPAGNRCDRGNLVETWRHNDDWVRDAR